MTPKQILSANLTPVRLSDSQKNTLKEIRAKGNKNNVRMLDPNSKDYYKYTTLGHLPLHKKSVDVLIKMGLLECYYKSTDKEHLYELTPKGREIEI